MSAAVQEQEQEQASVQEAVQEPTLRELLDEIREAVDAYKKREVSADKIRETLSKARREEAMHSRQALARTILSSWIASPRQGSRSK